MATLHLVNNSTALASCLAVASSADTLVLLEDGVYAVKEATRVTHVTIEDSPTLLAIAQDAQIRGVNLGSGVTAIDYHQLVELCTQHQPITSWC